MVVGDHYTYAIRYYNNDLHLPFLSADDSSFKTGDSNPGLGAGLVRGVLGPLSGSLVSLEYRNKTYTSSNVIVIYYKNPDFYNH